MDVTKTESDVKTEPNAVKAEGENKSPKLEDQASQGSSVCPMQAVSQLPGRSI